MKTRILVYKGGDYNMWDKEEKDFDKDSEISGIVTFIGIGLCVLLVLFLLLLLQ